MNITRERKLARPIATILTIVGALILGAGTTAAQAAPSPAAGFPTGPMTIEIHKYEQPDQQGQPADGLPITNPSHLPGTDPVSGATFEATRVPAIDLSTDAGQQQAASLTVAQAAERITDAHALPEATDTTDGAGDATLAVSSSGLYLVEETYTPAGFVPAAPFLVALPLTNPETLDSWLTTVHVYPKNARASISLTVDDEQAVVVGDTVSWRARASIPNQPTLGKYTIRQRIDPNLQLVNAPNAFTVTLDCPTCQPLVEGVDYTIAVESGTGDFIIDFTPAGRAALTDAIAANPGAAVVVACDTIVLRDGEFRNEVFLDVGGAAEVSASALTKWGPLAIEVQERGNPSHRVAGAKFQLFLSAQDAAAGTNPVTVDGVNEWTTDANGNVAINGLRFSNFVNGLDVQRGDPLFREYFVILTHVPDGYSANRVPIALTVESVVHADVALVEIWRSGGGGGGGLPVTGAQITGVVILATLLIGGGLLLVLRRRQRDDEEASHGGN